MVSGKRRISVEEMQKIAFFLGTEPPTTQGRSRLIGTVIVAGRLASGVWRTPRDSKFSSDSIVPAVPDPAYQGLAQSAYALDVDSTKGDLRTGDFLITLSYWQVRAGPQPKDTVVVRRRNGELDEWTARKVQASGNGRIILAPILEADGAGIIYDPNDKAVELVGLCIGLFRPFT